MTPAAPERQRLAGGAAALGVALDGQAVDRLLAFLELLERWNRTYNLSGVRDRDAMVEQHLLDCVAVLPSLAGQCPAARRLLDVGSGGGLPGIVIAILRDDLDVCCVDAVAKKAAFVRQAAGTLGLARLTSIHARVESLGAPGFDVITSRAFASLADFTRLTRRLVADDGAWMAMKGQRPDDEIAALPAGIDVFHVERLAGLVAERHLVWMRPHTG